MRVQGLGAFVARGALRRGLPMALGVIVVLELLEGGSFDRARLLTTAFLGRVAWVAVVFLVAGAVASFARWKSLEALYADRG